MTMRNPRTGWQWIAVLMAVLWMTAAAMAADMPGIITKKSGGQVSGMIRWQPASKVYLVTDRNSVAIRVPLSEVASIRVKEPAELESAAKLVQSGQFALAIGNLEKILQDYAMMGPDVKAARWLAEAYLKQGNATKAVQMCEKVMENNPEAASGELASIYWDALIGTSQFVKVKKALNEAVSKGNKQVAAMAQIKRGDIEKKQGNVKEALVDGYLRTVVLFQDVKDVQPEALYKAAKCFEELGQMSHADKMRKKLLAEYPGDPYSQKIQSGT